MPTLTKLFSMQEAAEHTSKDDCWVVIDGKSRTLRMVIVVNVDVVGGWNGVWDFRVLIFVSLNDKNDIDEHPGGDDVFLDAKGKDAKEEFEEDGHSQDARGLMEKFFIGELDLSAATVRDPEIPSNKAANVHKIKDLPTQDWVVPGAVVAIAVILGFLYFRK